MVDVVVFGDDEGQAGHAQHPAKALGWGRDGDAAPVGAGAVVEGDQDGQAGGVGKPQTGQVQHHMVEPSVDQFEAASAQSGCGVVVEMSANVDDHGTRTWGMHGQNEV
nr:hypothetical protein [Embleya scabrispora]